MLRLIVEITVEMTIDDPRSHDMNPKWLDLLSDYMERRRKDSRGLENAAKRAGNTKSHLNCKQTTLNFTQDPFWPKFTDFICCFFPQVLVRDREKGGILSFLFRGLAFSWMRYFCNALRHMAKNGILWHVVCFWIFVEILTKCPKSTKPDPIYL